MRNLRMGVVVVVACMGVWAATAAARVVRIDGHPFSLMAHGAAKPSPGGSSGGAVLLNHNGPVLTAEAPYLIYWAPGTHTIPGPSQALLNQYLTDVAADSGQGTNVYSVLGQYHSPYSQVFSATGKAPQAILDTQPYPAKQTGCKLATGMTACVNDGSLRAEIARLITAGTVPAPGKPGAGTTPIFFMITPVDVNVCAAGGCSSTSFCAYHTYFTSGGNDVLYASVPFSVFASSSKGCQTDGTPTYLTPSGAYSGNQAYNVADDLSHELSETITDPLINAWYSGNGLEVGDLCEAYGATADTSKGLSPLAYAPAFTDAHGGTYDQLINNHEYYNQTEYSNTAGQCEPGLT